MSSAPLVLSIDDSSPDQKAIKLVLANLIRSQEIRFVAVSSVHEALKVLSSQLVHVVLLDVDLRPAGKTSSQSKPNSDARLIDAQFNGVHAISLLKDFQSHLEVIMVTGHAEIDVGPASSRRGAHCIIEKRNLRHLENNIIMALKVADEKLSQLAAAFGGVDQIPFVVGPSAQASLERARIAAAVRAPSENILIMGEPGCGKTSRAKWIHTLRSLKLGKPSRPFENVNVSTWSEGMIERELFGHRKGSYTGAVGDGRGAIERAAGGTLFLDEIGELPVELQSKLLKLLQERVFTPLGASAQDAHCDIIAATNRDLSASIKNGSFRQDLFDRFSIVVQVAPLSERKKDLRYIIQAVLRGLNHSYPDSTLTLEAMPKELLRYLDKNEIRGGFRILEKLFKAIILHSPEDPFTGQRDFTCWDSIPEVKEALAEASQIGPVHDSNPRRKGFKDPITLEELAIRGLDAVGVPGFPGLFPCVDQFKELLYQDAWKKLGENKAVAAALGVGTATASAYTSRIRGKENQPSANSGLTVQLNVAKSEENSG